MYITKKKREKLLKQNDGYSTYSNYSGRNFKEFRRYTIENDCLHVYSKSRTSWADSRSEREWIADEKATNRFLHEHLDELDTSGVE